VEQVPFHVFEIPDRVGTVQFKAEIGTALSRAQVAWRFFRVAFHSVVLKEKRRIGNVFFENGHERD
jgi:hypothetical protein